MSRSFFDDKTMMPVHSDRRSKINPKPFIRKQGSFYVTFDGPEFCGKTTLLKQFETYLREKTLLTSFESDGQNIREFVIIREPGHTFAGKVLRQALLTKEVPLMDQIEYLRADRIVTQQLVTKPMLARGGLVLSDRSLITAYAYQGVMRDNLQQVIDLHESIPEFIYPDLSIVLECPTDVCMKRFQERSKIEGAEINYLDLKDYDFHEQARQTFKDAKSWSPIPYFNVDANRS